VDCQRNARLCNAAGMHARPCHSIVKTAQSFKSELWVGCEGREVNGKSILDLMTLCAPHEAVLSFRAHGPDAQELVSALVSLVEGGFGEHT
jgi:phosphocarrier protein HPr